MTWKEIECDAKFIIKAQINEIFEAYFRSNARETLFSDTRNVGVFSLNDSECDQFYTLKHFCNGNLINIQGYPIYKKFSTNVISPQVAYRRIFKDPFIITGSVIFTRFHTLGIMNFNYNNLMVYLIKVNIIFCNICYNPCRNVK